MKIQALAIAGVAALLASGCGGGSQASKTTPTSVTTSLSAPPTTTSATPTTWTKAEAGKAYLAMAKKINDVTDAQRTAFKSSNVKSATAACRVLAKASDEFMRSLDAGRWDPALRQAVDDLITDSANLRLFYQKCAKQTTLDGLDSLEAPSKEHEGAAQILRVKLGLPGN